MANKEQEQPKKNTGSEFLKDVLFFGLAIFAGSVILRHLSISDHHTG